MTNYHLKPPGHTPTTNPYQEAKEKRKKLLDEIRRRRAQRYKQFLRERYDPKKV